MPGMVSLRCSILSFRPIAQKVYPKSRTAKTVLKAFGRFGSDPEGAWGEIFRGPAVVTLADDPTLHERPAVEGWCSCLASFL